MRLRLRKVPRTGGADSVFMSWTRRVRTLRPRRDAFPYPQRQARTPWNEVPPSALEAAMSLIPDPGPTEPPDAPGQGHIRIPVVDRIRGKMGPGTPVGARRHILCALYDPKTERYVPSAHWAPPTWFRMDHKYGAGYPQVWETETRTRSPERPYLLRLDLARIVYEQDSTVEERFVTRSLEMQRLENLDVVSAPSFKRVDLTALAPPVDDASALPWVTPAPRVDILAFASTPSESSGRKYTAGQGVAEASDRGGHTPRGDQLESPGGTDHG